MGAWDGDNRHDVVERDAGTLYYHPGDGAGGFFPRVAISSGWDTINLVSGAGDMDRDGHTDFLARTTIGPAQGLPGRRASGEVLSTIYISSGWNANRIVLSPGDLTGDGRADVLAVRTSDDKLLLYPGTGTGKLGSPTTVSGSWAGYSALSGSGDVTGDGRDDVVGTPQLRRRARRVRGQRHGLAHAGQRRRRHRDLGQLDQLGAVTR